MVMTYLCILVKSVKKQCLQKSSLVLIMDDNSNI